MNNTDFSRVSALLETKKTFSICLPTTITLDNLAAALALYLMLVKMGKQAIIACIGNLGNTSILIGSDKVKRDLFSGGNDLLISFPNKQGSVDAVNYGFETDSFYIRITPEPDAEKLDPEKVQFSYTGGKPEVIFTIDTPALANLG